jgi:hypothetical protein
MKVLGGESSSVTLIKSVRVEINKAEVPDGHTLAGLCLLIKEGLKIKPVTAHCFLTSYHHNVSWEELSTAQVLPCFIA